MAGAHGRLGPEQEARLFEGIRLFNAGEHWHAHEAWEGLWLSFDADAERDDKRFVQGLIMAAAMLVQYERGVARGVANHYANAQARLAPHAPHKWGVDVADLLAQLEGYAVTAGEQSLKAEAVQVRWQP